MEDKEEINILFEIKLEMANVRQLNRKMLFELINSDLDDTTQLEIIKSLKHNSNYMKELEIKLLEQ